MAMILPILQLLPLVPVLVESAFKIVTAIRNSPGTPEEAKPLLDDLSVKLQAVIERVKTVKLPGDK